MNSENFRILKAIELLTMSPTFDLGVSKILDIFFKKVGFNLKLSTNIQAYVSTY